MFKFKKPKPFISKKYHLSEFKSSRGEMYRLFYEPHKNVYIRTNENFIGISDITYSELQIEEYFQKGYWIKIN